MKKLKFSSDVIQLWSNIRLHAFYRICIYTLWIGIVQFCVITFLNFQYFPILRLFSIFLYYILLIVFMIKGRQRIERFRFAPGGLYSGVLGPKNGKTKFSAEVPTWKNFCWLNCSFYLLIRNFSWIIFSRRFQILGKIFDISFVNNQKTQLKIGKLIFCIFQAYPSSREELSMHSYV
jgi:hypothetical protein